MSEVATTAVAAPKGVSTETVVATFGTLAAVTQKALQVALKGGVNAAAIIAVTSFKVTLLGGTKNQAHFLIFGTEKPAKHDSGEAKMWRAGWALAGHWRFQKALPQSIAGANSDEAAFVAACDWLAAEGISSLVGLEDHIAKAKGVTATRKEREAKPIAERAAAMVSKAEAESVLSVTDVAEMARLMLRAMSTGNGSAFAAAVLEEHTAMCALRAAKAAELVQSENPDFQPEAEAAAA